MIIDGASNDRSVSTSGTRIPALDGIRGLAILGVMLVHFTAFIATGSAASVNLRRLFSGGWAGVDLFFVLSGFLITGILFDAKGSGNYFRRFYVRRALRILPIYYLALAVAFIAASAPWSEQVWYWFYLQNYHVPSPPLYFFLRHFWTLAIEEQFYLVWPFIIAISSRRQALKWCVFLIALSIAYRIGGLLILTDVRQLYFQTPARLDGLALGAALALQAREPGGLESLRLYLKPATISGAAVIALIFVHARFLNPYDALMLAVGYTALALLSGAILVESLTRPLGHLHGWTTHRWLMHLGKYSYGMYVIHFPLREGARLLGVTAAKVPGLPAGIMSAIVYIPAMIAATLVAALLSWRLIESPFLSLKLRWRVAEERSVAAAA